MHVLRPALIAAALLLVPALTHAQGERVTIRGIVVDRATGQPIPGAAVEINGTNDRIGTNAEGRFLLSGARPGSLLVVSQLGYSMWAMEVDTAAVVRVELDVQPIVMERLEVVTDRLKERWRASPVPMRTYTSDQMITTSASNARDFAYLRASFGSCRSGSGDCIYWRGQLLPPSICVDDIPYGSDVNVLIGLPIHDLHLVEIQRRYIRVYTKQFAERLARGQVRLMPIMPIADRAC